MIARKEWIERTFTNRTHGNITWVNSYATGLLLLTNRKTNVRMECKVDNEDVAKLKFFQWCPAYSPGIKSNYLVTVMRVRNWKRKLESLHRIVLNMVDDNLVVDHINHDTLDNRKSNLRIVTPRGNLQNSIRNSSGYPGVSWNKPSAKWMACMLIGKRNVTLGRFSDIKDAARAVYFRGQEEFGLSSPYKLP